MERLVEKQKQLMEYVPHDVRPDALVKMVGGIKVLDTLLRFLNSTGHKPWRPIPLSPGTQQVLLAELKGSVNALAYIQRTNLGADKDLSDQEHYSRQVVSTFGVVEEAIEYVNSLTKGGRAEQMEELTDMLFFWLEQLILSGFTWDEVVAEYFRKWDKNMERYRRAKEGDYKWDDRDTKKEL